MASSKLEFSIKRAVWGYGSQVQDFTDIFNSHINEMLNKDFEIKQETFEKWGIKDPSEGNDKILHLTISHGYFSSYDFYAKEDDTLSMNTHYVVISAQWGYKDKIIDAAQRLQQCVDWENVIKIVTDCFGDPAKDETKTLTCKILNTITNTVKDYVWKEYTEVKRIEL